MSDRQMTLEQRQDHIDRGVPMLFDDWTLYRGWTLHWHGWREPVNQIVRMGFWTAHAPQEPEFPCVYRTTYGGWGFHASEFCSLDVTAEQRWRTPIGTDADKRDALLWLVAQIDHGRFRPSILQASSV